MDIAFAGGAVEHRLGDLDLGCSLGGICGFQRDIHRFPLELDFLGGGSVLLSSLLALSQSLGSAWRVRHRSISLEVFAGYVWE